MNRSLDMHDDDGVSPKPENRNTTTWAFILRHSSSKSHVPPTPLPIRPPSLLQLLYDIFLLSYICLRHTTQIYFQWLSNLNEAYIFYKSMNLRSYWSEKLLLLFSFQPIKHGLPLKKKNQLKVRNRYDSNFIHFFGQLTEIHILTMAWLLVKCDD